MNIILILLIAVLLSMFFYVFVEIIFVFFVKSPISFMRLVFLYRNVNKFKFLGKSHYYYLYLFHNNKCYVLKYAKDEPTCFRFGLIEEDLDSNKNFHCQLGQFISGTIFSKICKKLNKRILEEKIRENVKYIMNFEESEEFMKEYKIFSKIAKRNKIIKQFS